VRARDTVLGCLTDTGWLLLIGFAGLFLLVFVAIIGAAFGYLPGDDWRERGVRSAARRGRRQEEDEQR
jgi:hypothetical protein